MERVDKKKSLYADMSMFLVAILWGGGFVAVKDALDNITPMYIMAARFGISFILMLIIFWKRIKKTNKQDIIAGTVVGIFLFTAFSAQTIGLQYTTAGKQAFLTGTNVVIVPFLVWILHKKSPDRYTVIAAFLSLIGIGLLTVQGSLSVNVGGLLTLLCALLFAAHIVSVGYYTEKTDPFILATIQLGAAAVFSVISALIFESAPTSLNLGSVWAVCYLGIFSTMVAFLIQNVAQKYTYSTHAAVILCTESVFGSIFAVIFLGDRFTVEMILGCLLIFAAILTSETKWKFLRRIDNITLK